MFVLGIVPENIQKFEIIIQLERKRMKLAHWTGQHRKVVKNRD